MKIEKWTLGLASVGLVSLASVAQAEERLSTLGTALSATTLSGHVDVSAQWNVGRTGNLPAYSYGGPGKADGFNLNVVNLTLEKPLDESVWSAGYRVDLAFGADARELGTGVDSWGDSSFGTIRQAYAELGAPIGTGLSIKAGVWDTIIGFESFDSYKNPNFTRSYGYSLEPTTHTGLLATYRFGDLLAASVGIANDFGPTINSRAHPAFGFVPEPRGNRSETFKTYMGALTLTAPDSFGFAGGSTLSAGIIDGYNHAIGNSQTSYYVGATIATPLEMLRLGAAFDYVESDLSKRFPGVGDLDAWAAALYASVQATEKLSLHTRAEYTEIKLGAAKDRIGALTGTLQYDLWQNVLSRLEVRWDRKFRDGLNPPDRFGRNLDDRDEIMVAGNLVYKF
jgi:hypothetical protein